MAGNIRQTKRDLYTTQHIGSSQTHQHPEPETTSPKGLDTKSHSACFPVQETFFIRETKQTLERRNNNQNQETHSVEG